MSLYVYCLSEEKIEGALESVRGIEGTAPHLMSCGAISAVVSEFAGERVSLTRENVLAHQQVIDLLLAETTPLPFRFGALVTALQLQNYIDSQTEHLEALFARVRGAVEMSVKILWDKDAVRSDTEDAELARQREGAGGFGPGRAFLLARQREILGEGILKRRAEEIALWLKESLSDVVRETVLSVEPAEAMVIRAAHLVERLRVDLYRERIKRARRERLDLRFLTSGAWPPYSFTTLNTRNS